MNILLKLICIFSISVKTWSSADDPSVFDRCGATTYYKPYAKVLMKMGDDPIKEISSTGFLDLSGLTRVILCLNGPAFLYKGVELEDTDDLNVDPKPKAYTNGTLGVYEHDCKSINHITKHDTMNARAGNVNGGVINLYRQVYGVYLIGVESDYRLPEMVHFIDDHFSHIVTSSVGASSSSGHSFAMIGDEPGDGFCTTVTFVEDDGSSKTYKLKVRTEPGRISGPHISLRRGTTARLDDIFNMTLNEFSVWIPCNTVPGARPRSTTPSSVAGNDTNLTQYQPFATFGKGTKVPVPLPDSQEQNTNTGSTTRPKLICKFDTCDVVLSDRTKALPDLSRSAKCGPGANMGKLTDNKCYFWQYTADVFLLLSQYNDLHWRQNALDEVRKIVEISCPMVPPRMVKLANQILIGYFAALAKQNAPNGIQATTPQTELLLMRVHKGWLGELMDTLVDCRKHANAMEFNYTSSTTAPGEEFLQTKRSYVRKLNDQSSLYYSIYSNRTADPEEAEDAAHIEERKPPIESDFYRQEYPSNIKLVKNNTLIPLFYYREGIELEKALNYAIDVAWKAIATTIGYCNTFYQPKKPELFPRYYNAFFEDFFEVLDPYWVSSADNEYLRYFVEEFMDNKAVNLWLDSCLEASYIYSDSPTYRPPRPLVYVEQNEYIANYFLELPNDVSILSSKVTNPLKNFIRSTKFKRQINAKTKERISQDVKVKEPINERLNEIDGDETTISDVEDQNTVTEREVHERPKGRIMG